MAYQPNPIKTEGGQKETIVSDDNVQSTLRKILKELKIMNIQLSMITDNWIEKGKTRLECIFANQSTANTTHKKHGKIYPTIFKL